MIGLIQRVSQAIVSINNEQYSHISAGMLVLLGIEKNDSEEQACKLAKKIANIRIFEDSLGKMNANVQDFGGEILIVSQFTLAADTKKGNRPGFSSAASPEESEALYNYFISHYNNEYMQKDKVCKTGIFGANMQINLTNDGPATFYLQM